MNINKKNKKLPPYLDFIYGDIYNNPEKCKKENNLFACNLRTFFQYGTLVRSLNKELK